MNTPVLERRSIKKSAILFFRLLSMHGEFADKKLVFPGRPGLSCFQISTKFNSDVVHAPFQYYPLEKR